MAEYKSPGVYVEEIPLLPPSIAEVESAVPAFVGYTEKAMHLVADDLLNVATPINSFADYVQFYGGPDSEDPTNFTVSVDQTGTAAAPIFKAKIAPVAVGALSSHILYHAVKHFYANGGGRCYILSVARYDPATTPKAVIDPALLLAGIDLIGNEDEPTMLVVPEAVKIAGVAPNTAPAGFISIIQKMLKQASDMRDRFAILDTYQTTVPKVSGTTTTDAKTGIDNVQADNTIRRFGAMYYPFLQTTYPHVTAFDSLKLTHHTFNGGAAVAPQVDLSGAGMAALKLSASSLYNAVSAEWENYSIVLPPSAAIAGVYARVDSTRGVWKAPANVGLTDVTKPVISIARAEQDLLNVNADTGKSVNAILAVPGYGTVVMGARTLDGNDDEWRYVNVRRFFSVVEESIKKSTNWVVFEPNTAPTWIKVQAMIENYLFLKWRDGALAGAKPEQAFFVRVGLNQTMTPQDILQGRLIIQVGMAVARPAEFVVLQFEQMMQAS